MKKIVLASASPRRRALLEQVGWQFEVKPSNFAELDLHASSNPPVVALHNALGKAREVAAHCQESLVLGADTIVVHEGKLLGKPRDRQDAADMLRLLSGCWHEVITAIALVDSLSGVELTDCVTTRVHMRCLTEAEIVAYLNTDEPYDKAGAYGIQGKAAAFIDQIDGCYFNVVGLPLSRLAELRQQLSAVWC